MKKNIFFKSTLFIIVLVIALANCLNIFAGTASDRFSDTESFKGMEFESVLDSLVDKGILKGISDENGEISSSINNYITRAEFVTLIARAKILNQYTVNSKISIGEEKLLDDYLKLVLDAKANYFESKFNDIDNHWAEQYIKFSESEGMILGYSDKTFKADKLITYDEAYSIVFNASKQLDTTIAENVFSSVFKAADIKAGSYITRISALLVTDNLYKALTVTDNEDITKPLFSPQIIKLLNEIKQAKSFDEAKAYIETATIEGSPDYEIYVLLESTYTNKSWDSNNGKILQKLIAQKGGWIGKYYSEDMNPIWPSNNGFWGEPYAKTLEPGTKIDRYGYPTGRFSSPYDCPYSYRAVLPGTKETSPYNVYEVVEAFDVLAGDIAPWFGMPGGGIQYFLNDGRNYQDLLDAGIIKKVN